MLSKQAEGLKALVDAAGGDAREAVLMLIADQLPELVKTQVEAIKGIKIDKVTVWEGGGGNGGSAAGNGAGSTANFVSGLYKSVPPLRDLFDMAGMNLPEYLGTEDVAALNSGAVETEAQVTKSSTPSAKSNGNGNGTSNGKSKRPSATPTS